MGMSSPEEATGGRSLLDSLPSADSLSGAGAKNNADPIPFDDDDIPF